MTTTSTEIRLARRPPLGSEATPECFVTATVDVPDPQPGEVRVANHYLSVDPYMRGRMNDIASYVPPFAVGAALEGGAVGVVTASRDDSVPEGSLVSSNFGWREGFTTTARQVRLLPDPPDGVSESAYLGALGMPGMTAWVGLTVIAPVQPGDVVFVSAASGAVGSISGQLAKARGASVVIGSAGSPAKVAAVREVFGFDASFTHTDAKTESHLADAAPKGIDVYFDNVGGEQLRAAINAARPFGRFALCGSISSGYTGGAGSAVDNVALLVGKRLSLRGFIVSDHADRQAEFVEEVGRLIGSGQIVVRETVVDGVQAAPQAFLSLFGGGDQVGKVVVRV